MLRIKFFKAFFLECISKYGLCHSELTKKHGNGWALNFIDNNFPNLPKEFPECFHIIKGRYLNLHCCVLERKENFLFFFFFLSEERIVRGVALFFNNSFIEI